MISVGFSGATASGTVTTATFGWSATGCPAAVRIEFFRPFPQDSGPLGFHFLASRGPFDVTNPVRQGAAYEPPVTQTVALVPPVAVQQGDVIAITNLTSCGGPAFFLFPVTELPSSTYIYAGDVQSDVTAAAASFAFPPVFVYATDSGPGLVLLGARFEVSLTATDPRTGETAVGFPVPLDDGAGYFSLPAYTQNAAFPEVTVKMVDATAAAPPFGGAFWFFHASLTDVAYSLSVRDFVSGLVRTYTSAGSPSFCGGADTNAFSPP
jgi:hypothetical protein